MNTFLSVSPTQLCQQDFHWRNHLIGASNSTIAHQGCALCGVSMISAEFGGFKDPAFIAAHPELFLIDKILWKLVNRVVPCVKFIWRQFGYDPSMIADFVVPGEKATLLQVPINAKLQEYHWLKVVKIVKTGRGTDYLVNDPYTGRPCLAIVTYGSITGSAHFVKA